MKKKVLVLLLTVSMVFSLAGCKKASDDSSKDTTTPTEGATASDTTGEATNETDTTATAVEASGQLIIGNTTELSGDFVPYFQNNAADYDIGKFIEGYPTADITSGGEYVINNTVVKEYKTTANDDGSKTYTFTINSGLQWNDGSAISAVDYVTSAMLWSSKVVGDMGADTSVVAKYFKGWADFSQGTSKNFTGVNLISDDTFAITIDAQYLPYFYELGMVGLNPTKLSFWTDDTVTIKDDGQGCYFSDNFTKDAYEAKINAARGAIPRVTSGAYNLTSYDEASKTAVLDVNPLYLGDYQGQKAQIKTLIYKKVTTETEMDELKTGAVDLLTGMATGDEINAGLDLVDAGGFSYTAYDRNGYGKLQLICDFGPTQFVEVRQALAYLLDRNDFAKSYTGGFGSVVNGPYGPAMWMYQDTKDELDSKLNQYAYSLDAAKKVLEEGGWIYDEKGNAYSSGIRYKKLDDGSLMPLILEWASSDANPVSELLVVKLQNNPDVAAAGMQINQTVMTFSELLNYIYRDGSQDQKYAVPTYNMFNLGTGFTPMYDMSSTYTMDPALYATGANDNWLQDEQLYQLAQDMVKTDPTDKSGFETKFVSFLQRWNELLPDIPLYSNIYHDFYNAKLKDYNVNAIWGMTNAIIYSHIEE